MSLLIAEDNQRTRQMIKTVVADLASAIYECENGAAAITAYAAQRPDLVLMDIQMPELSGLAATRRIKADWPSARIVVVTNFDDEETRAEALAAGAYAVVGKENLLALRALLEQMSSPTT